MIRGGWLSLVWKKRLLLIRCGETRAARVSKHDVSAGLADEKLEHTGSSMLSGSLEENSVAGKPELFSNSPFHVQIRAHRVL
jgi:hypothetical protein